MKDGLSSGDRIILEFVKSMVNNLHSYDIDENAIEQRISDIVTECEELAMDIEKGKFEMSCNETGT